MRSMKITLLMMLLLLLVAACAPDDLDITPSPTTAPTATPAPTRDPSESATEQPTEQAAEDTNRITLDTIIAALPNSIGAGNATWNKAADETTHEEIVYQDQEGGVTAKVFYSESGGSFSELTFGVFDTPEAAQAYFDRVKGRTRTLESAETRDNFPTPNYFGGGTYGSDAIFVQGPIYIRISVPRFSSTMGDPLGPYARALFRIVDPVIAPLIGSAEATAEATTAP